VNTLSTTNDEKHEATAVSPEIAEQVRLALVELLDRPPPALAGIPVELWLKRVIPVSPTAADLLSLTPETVLKRFRAQLIPLDGRKFGMRLGDVFRLKGRRKKAA
jgi:hypothetical protein